MTKAARAFQAQSGALLARQADGDYHVNHRAAGAGSQSWPSPPLSRSQLVDLTDSGGRHLGPWLLLTGSAAAHALAAAGVPPDPEAKPGGAAVLPIGPDGGEPTHVLVLELPATPPPPRPTTADAVGAAIVAGQLTEALAGSPQRLRKTRPSAALARERRLLRGLLEAGASVHEALNLDQVLQQVAAILGKAGGFDAVAVYIREDATGLLHPRAIIGVDAKEAERMRTMPLTFADYLPLMRPEMRISRSYLFDHRKHEMPPESILEEALSVPEMPADWRPGQWHPKDSLTIPLDLGHGQPQGLISLDRPRDRRYPDRATIRALELFADQCAAAIARAQLHNQMEQLASTDPLTGLHNRRALASTIASDLARAGRSGQPYSILFCDLDHFKQLNDRWGHAIGDQMLQQVAATLRQRVRRGDFVARYGGDEFVVLLPDTTLAAACVVAEELRERVGADATSRPITISIGAAAAEPGDEDWAELVAAADAAMYLAKQQGRNRVRSQRNLPANADAGSRRLTG